MTKTTITEPPYWLVWRPGGAPPTFKHNSPISAEKEAIRLAQCRPGESFFVLCPIAKITHQHTVIERFDPTDDGIPF